MSAVKRKLNNVSLIQKRKAIRLIEKAMTNKAAYEKFKIPGNTISTWIKNKSKLLQSLEQTSSNTKKLRGCDYEQVQLPLQLFFAEKNSIFQTSKFLMVGWVSGKKVRKSIQLLQIKSLFF